MKKVLVTGGLGFIGSHTVVELCASGFEVIIIDNLSNADISFLDRIQSLTKKSISFYQIDACNATDVMQVFEKEKNIDIVIHFAAFKSVGESVLEPIKYFKNNINSLVTILDCMKKANVHHIIFSSSATVYGDPDELPVFENSMLKKPLCAYGSTKQIGEEIIEKVQNIQIKSIILRYFNPVGAHPSGLIGELPIGTPANLLPFITQTAIGKQKELVVFGSDYPTPDGSCIRDYVHVVDLAQAHVVSCTHLLKKDSLPYDIFNIGTNKGISVLEMIRTFEKENNIKINYRIGPRRAGDACSIYANVDKANRELHWKAEKDIRDMVIDAWRWERNIKK